jgi:hypothetical protein
MLRQQAAYFALRRMPDLGRQVDDYSATTRFNKKHGLSDVLVSLFAPPLASAKDQSAV